MVLDTPDIYRIAYFSINDNRIPVLFCTLRHNVFSDHDSYYGDGLAILLLHYGIWAKWMHTERVVAAGMKYASR